MTDRRWDTERQEWVWPEDEAKDAQIRKLRDALIAAKRPHYVCEDCFYSCPKSGECCNEDERSRNRCNCGADAHNAKIDEALNA